MLRKLLASLVSRTKTKPVAPQGDGTQNLLALIEDASKAGDSAALDDLCRRAEMEQLSSSQVWQRLGRAQAQSGNLASSEALLSRALAIDANDADTLSYLANVHQLRGDESCALLYYERALACDANHRLSLRNASFVYLRQSNITKALPLLERLFLFDPLAPAVAEHLAAFSLSRNDNERALIYLAAARNASPTDAKIYAVTAATYAKLGNLAQALSLYRKSWELNSSDADVANNFGYLLTQLGDIDEAVAVLERAVTCRSDFADGLNNLAIAYLRQGRRTDAEQKYRAAIAANPTRNDIRGNLLLCLNYSDQISRDELYRAHLDWAAHIELTSDRLKPIQPKSATQRRLRIGYVSPDFVTHPVATFIEPILREHDREKFYIVCYSNNPAPDDTTERLKALVEDWRDIYTLDDNAAAELIRADKIDILVDLAGHTGRNRLVMMKRKPAPIQLTYLGYPNTTGLGEIDFRISDDYVDDATAQQFYTETLIRLRRCFLCYQPPTQDVALTTSPRDLSDGINFCTFNNLAKITDAMIATWATILNAVPHSSMYLPGAALQATPTRQRWLERFAALGIADHQIKWTNRAPSVASHLERYRMMDVAFDTFPYNGTTTTMDALWMGVPVVSMYGPRHASRVTYDLLSRLGLARWAASTHDQYIDIAVKLAQMGPRDAILRRELRNAVAHSELLNARDMAASLEQAYLDIWKQKFGISF